jgi:hypothetical protein
MKMPIFENGTDTSTDKSMINVLFIAIKIRQRHALNDFKTIVRRSVYAQHEKIYSVIFLVAVKMYKPMSAYILCRHC